MRRDFLAAMQRLVAVGALPASALRGQRTPGLTRGLRRALSELDLRLLSQTTEARFRAALDDANRRLSRTRGARCEWGVARKALNLFMRSALYNHHLREAYRLQRIEAFLEIPLDAIVARHIRGIVPSAGLPYWKSMRALTPELSDRYQAVASELAKARGVARVPLTRIAGGAERPAAAS